MRTFGFWVFLALCGVLVICGLCLTSAAFVETQMQEDQTVETASAIALLLGILLSAVAVHRRAGGVAVLLGVLSTVLFLSEISFGERLIGFTPPTVHGIKIDAVHDLLALSWAVVASEKLYLLFTALFSLFAVGLLVVLLRTSRGFKAIATHRVMPVIAASLTLIAAGQFVDFGLGQAMLQHLGGNTLLDFVERSYFEEAAEFMSAVLIFVAARKLLVPQANGVSTPA